MRDAPNTAHDVRGLFLLGVIFAAARAALIPELACDVSGNASPSAENEARRGAGAAIEDAVRFADLRGITTPPPSTAR